MDIAAFVNDGWSTHGDDPAGVWARLPGAIPHLSAGSELLSVASLAVHVIGEHLGRWGDGVAFLGELRQTPAFDTDAPEGRATWRLEAALLLCSGDRTGSESALGRASEGGDPAVQRVRMLSLAASALCGQGRVADAAAAFEAALAIDAEGSARSLAIMGNNLACTLEEKTDRSAEEVALMKRAASVAREQWAIAGTWVNVRIAEYRLAMTHLQAGEPAVALTHAALAQALVDENGGDAGDRFFPLLAEAEARHALDDVERSARALDAAARALPDVHADMLDYCADELEKVRLRVGA